MVYPYEVKTCSDLWKCNAMEKQEIRITRNQWPVLLKQTEEGTVEAVCPFFADCHAKGQTTEEAIKKVEKKIVSKIGTFDKVN